MNKPDGRHTKLDLTEQEGKESLSKAPNIKCCSAKIHQHPVHAFIRQLIWNFVEWLVKKKKAGHSFSEVFRLYLLYLFVALIWQTGGIQSSRVSTSC